jgi:uncharacterized protein (DUF362 family)
MKHLSRRKFLEITGVMAATGIVQACTPQASPADTANVPTNTPFSPGMPTPSKTEAPAETKTETATETATETSKPSASLPYMAVAKNGEPGDLTRRAVNAIGGMSRFVFSGANVVIKPNICVNYRTYEYAATTNPWVVGELVKMAFEAGAGSVKVMDLPFDGSAQSAYVTSGVQEQVIAAGGEMVVMQGFKYQDVEMPNSVFLKRAQIYGDILNADVLINTPIAKHHGSARLTLSMKNLMGVVVDRGIFHNDFSNALPDLSFRVKSHLVVVDAVRILTASGPQGGDLGDVQKFDTVIATTDVVAADAYASTLFGQKSDYLKYVRVAAQRGLGISDLNSISIANV